MFWFNSCTLFVNSSYNDKLFSEKQRKYINDLHGRSNNIYSEYIHEAYWGGEGDRLREEIKGNVLVS